jgi:two-component system KDP operon response regulator KdpE
MTPAIPVLVVEDEVAMRRFLRASLTGHGYTVIEVERGEPAIAVLTSQRPALVLLDLGLPDVDGVELTRRIREWSEVPIIVLSARGREDDKVAALDAGADDYLTKPFAVGELLARMRVALRHASARAGAATEEEPRYRVGELELDVARHEVRRGGELVHLTPIEFKLLHLLFRHAGRVLTHRQILVEVWGQGAAGHSHYVRVHLAELRKKIEVEPSRPRLIVTEPGVGYRLTDPADT